MTSSFYLTSAISLYGLEKRLERCVQVWQIHLVEGKTERKFGGRVCWNRRRGDRHRRMSGSWHGKNDRRHQVSAGESGNGGRPWVNGIGLSGTGVRGSCWTNWGHSASRQRRCRDRRDGQNGDRRGRGREGVAGGHGGSGWKPSHSRDWWMMDRETWHGAWYVGCWLLWR